MDETSAYLLRVKEMIEAADHLVRRVLDGAAELSDDDRDIVASTMVLMAGLDPRSRADVLCWLEAAKVGDGGWLVLHSRQGLPEPLVEATYHGRLSREQRAILGR